MGENKSFLDSFFNLVHLNDVIERGKCRATGKVRFNTKSEAKLYMVWLKWRYKKWLKSPKRRKKSANKKGGKPRLRYEYSCEHCSGYHLTKENPYDHQLRKEKYNRKYFG